jgi:hypothetical protein
MELTVPQRLEKRILPMIATAELLKERMEYRVHWFTGLVSVVVGALAGVGVAAPIGKFLQPHTDDPISIWQALAGFQDSGSLIAKGAFATLVGIVVGRAVLEYLEFGQKGQSIGDYIRRFRQWLAEIDKILAREDGAAQADLDKMRNAMIEEASRGVQAGFLQAPVSADKRVDVRVAELLEQFRRSHAEVFERAEAQAVAQASTGQQKPRPASPSQPDQGAAP